jgi:hypothetical protein
MTKWKHDYEPCMSWQLLFDPVMSSGANYYMDSTGKEYVYSFGGKTTIIPTSQHNNLDRCDI